MTLQLRKISLRNPNKRKEKLLLLIIHYKEKNYSGLTETNPRRRKKKMQEKIKMAYLLTHIKYGCSKITIMSYCVYNTCIRKTS